MTSNADTSRALKACPLFRSFTDTGVQILSSVAVQKKLPADSPLFVESMIGEGLFVIISGKVQLSAMSETGGTVDLGVLEAPESLGEAALLRAGPRMCTAKALTEVQVLEISRRDIAQLQRTKPQACLKLMMSVVDALGTRTKAMDDDFRKFFSWRLGAG